MKEHVLIVDDDPISLSVTKGLLSEWGYKTKTETSGYAAIKICEKEKFDLIVMDVEMPGMSGIEAGQAITSKDRIAILYFTSQSKVETVQEAIKKGGFGYIIKPTNPDQLKSFVLAAIGRSREITALNKALQKSSTINIAIGIAMERYHLSKDDASSIIRRASRQQRKKIIEVAEDFIEHQSNISELIKGTPITLK